MIRIAHIADLHYDLSSRWAEHIRVMAWIQDHVLTNGYDALVCSGDVFERTPILEELDAATDFFTEVARVMPVIIVRGNHDHSAEFYGWDRLHNVSFVQSPRVVELRLGPSRRACAFQCLPWPSKGTLLAAVGDASAEEAARLGAEALQNVIGGLVSGIGGGTESPAKVFVGHCMVRGALTSHGQPLIGHEFEVGLEDLALARSDAYLLGHVHASQEWRVGDAPAAYCGSPRRTTWGEVETKGFGCLEIDDAGVARWCLVPTPATPMVLLNATWDAETRRLLLAGAGMVDVPPGADVRLRYAVDAAFSEQAAAAADAMRQGLLADGAVEVKLDRVMTRTVARRAPEVSQATTLEAKLRAMWSREGWDGPTCDRLWAKVSLLEDRP